MTDDNMCVDVSWAKINFAQCQGGEAKWDYDKKVPVDKIFIEYII